MTTSLLCLNIMIEAVFCVIFVTECNCFGHSDTCYYDSNVAAQGASLNARGELSGGGVCVECRDNTTGMDIIC